MPWKALIADDEEPARRKMARLLAEDAGIEIAGQASTGREAIELLRQQRADLLFLDIRMPDMDGFEVLARCEVDPLPEVVFVTAYDEYAVRAFEVRALSYLLKPYDSARFHNVLRYVKERLQQKEGHPQPALLELLETHFQQPRYPRRLLIRDGERARLVTPEEIDWVESARNNVVLHSKGATFVLRGTLDAFEEKLDPIHFARISRSHIVRLDRVAELNPWFHGEYKVRLDDGTELTWTRRYLQNLPASP